MVSGRFRSVLSALLICLLGLMVIGVAVVVGGEYQGLEPGVSKKSDVDKLFGSPQREVIRGVKYDYNPPADDTRRVSVAFSKVGKVVERIDIYPRDSYTKAQFREWFEIKEPDKTERDAKGNLVEYYVLKGMILHLTGPDDTAPVEFFSHLDPSSPEMRRITGGGLVERPPDIDKAPKDSHKVRSVVLLADDFDLENRSKGALNFYAFKNWEVHNGSVDIIGNGFWDFYPGRGLYLDLDGSTAKAGTLLSKTSFRLEPGKYRVQFDLAGSPLSGPNTVTVELGSVYRENFTLAMKAPFDTVVRDISVSSPVRAKLSFRNSGGDNQGLLLDNVKFMKISAVGTPPLKIPPLQTPKKSEAYYEKASKEAKDKKDYVRLKTILDEGLQYYPGNSNLWKDRATYYFRCKSEPPAVRKREMLRSAIKAFELDPSDGSAADVGWVYQEVFKDCLSAIRYYEMEDKEFAIKKPRIYYYMAICYENIGEFDKAITHFDRFVRAAPNDEKTSDARRRLNTLRRR